MYDGVTQAGIRYMTVMEHLWIITVAIIFLGAIKGQDELEEEPESIVETPLGFIKGLVRNNILGGSYHAFYKIPFAKPPIGSLRFMPPVPVEPWEGEYSAEEPAEACIQVSNSATVGVEDCLYLRVFTPKDPVELRKNPVPVFFYIHGGGFHFGSAALEPDLLVDKDIIVVIPSYRLSVFGFLSFQDEVVPGNVGLKDLVLALQWVRDNIGAFGGDPNSVTIGGVSAGSIAAHCLMLSPKARGLFKGAALESGTAFSSFAISLHPRDDAALLSNMYNCSGNDGEVLLKCLQEVDAEQLVQDQYNVLPLQVDFLDEFLFFTVCIEPKHPGAFLTEDPYDIIKAGNFSDVPFLIGISSLELGAIGGGLRSKFAPKKHIENGLIFLNSALKNCLPRRMPFGCKMSMWPKVRKFYFNDEAVTAANGDNMSRMLSDISFLIPNSDTVELQQLHQKSNIYLYLFTANFPYNLKTSYKPFITMTEAAHADEMTYLFNNPAFKYAPERKGFATVNFMRTLWSSFVKYGNPTPDDSLGVKWLPTSKDSPYYLDIGQDLTLKKDLQAENVKFWKLLRGHKV